MRRPTCRTAHAAWPPAAAAAEPGQLTLPPFTSRPALTLTSPFTTDLPLGSTNLPHLHPTMPPYCSAFKEMVLQPVTLPEHIFLQMDQEAQVSGAGG